MAEKQTTAKETKKPSAKLLVAGAAAMLLAANVATAHTAEHTTVESRPTVDRHAELVTTVGQAAQEYAAAIEDISLNADGAIKQSIEKDGDVTLSYSVPATPIVGDGPAGYDLYVRTRPDAHKSAIDPAQVTGLSLDVYTDGKQAAPTTLYSLVITKSGNDWLINEGYATKGESVNHDYTTNLTPNDGRETLDGLTLGYMQLTAEKVLDGARSQQPVGLVLPPSPK
jgi:hypothetical protein